MRPFMPLTPGSWFFCDSAPAALALWREALRLYAPMDIHLVPLNAEVRS